MRIIVSDTSCIIDLRKAALLQETLRLPYTFVTVNTLYEEEWLSLNDDEKRGEARMTFALNHLEPTEFENFCFDVLRSLDFVNLSWRKGTGLAASPADQGRDIEGEL